MTKHQKVDMIQALISLVVELAGYIYLASINWHIAIAVLVIMWGVNIGHSIEHRRIRKESALGFFKEMIGGD